MKKNSSERCPCCGRFEWFDWYALYGDASYYDCICGAVSYDGLTIEYWPPEIPKGFLAVDLGEPEEVV